MTFHRRPQNSPTKYIIAGYSMLAIIVTHNTSTIIHMCELSGLGLLGINKMQSFSGWELRQM